MGRDVARYRKGAATRAAVLALAAEGLSQRQIGRRLGLSKSAAGKYLVGLVATSAERAAATREQVTALCDLGLSRTEIASRLGISHTTVCAHVKAAGCHIEDLRRTRTRERVAELLDAGLEVKEIAARLGVCAQRVYALRRVLRPEMHQPQGQTRALVQELHQHGLSLLEIARLVDRSKCAVRSHLKRCAA